MINFFHATPFEWVFFWVALSSLVASILTYRDAVLAGIAALASLDKQPLQTELEKKDAVIVRLVAEQNTRQEIYRTIKSIIIVLVAICYLLMPPPPPDYFALPQSLVGLLGYVLLAGVQLFNSLLDKSARHLFTRLHDQTPPKIIIDPSGDGPSR